MSKISRPETLAQVRDELGHLYVQVMGDQRMCGQVSEGANALGKMIHAGKLHLEALAASKQRPTGEWATFLGVDQL